MDEGKDGYGRTTNLSSYNSGKRRVSTDLSKYERGFDEDHFYTLNCFGVLQPLLEHQLVLRLNPKPCKHLLMWQDCYPRNQTCFHIDRQDPFNTEFATRNLIVSTAYVKTQCCKPVFDRGTVSHPFNNTQARYHNQSQHTHCNMIHVNLSCCSFSVVQDRVGSWSLWSAWLERY